MPYKRDGSDAPDFISALPAKKRRQWIAIFNDSLKRCEDEDGDDCEARAFAQANGTVLKKEEVDMHDEEQEQIVVPVENETTAPPAAPEEVVPVAPVDDPAPEPETPNPTPGNGYPDRAVAAVATEMDIDTVIGHLQAALEGLRALQQPEAPDDEEPEEPEMPETTAETFAESAVPFIRLMEDTPPRDRRSPLEMEVGIIKAGPGNKRDNHYYGREMLERDGKVFEGLTMHIVDHREDLRSEGTDVSTVKKILGVRELADGAYLVGRVVAYDPNFCEKTRNRAEKGLLDKLQCSILAQGEAQPGEVDGAEYNIVTGITEGRFVDWVTRAGAGGHALALAESDAQTEEVEEPEETETQELDAGPQPVTLSEDAQPVEEVIRSLALAEVIQALGETNLPAPSVAKLASAPYANLTEVQTAVAAEVARLKAAGSGQPLGTPVVPHVKTKSITELQAEMQAVNQKWLGGK